MTTESPPCGISAVCAIAYKAAAAFLYFEPPQASIFQGKMGRSARSEITSTRERWSGILDVLSTSSFMRDLY